MLDTLQRWLGEPIVVLPATAIVVVLTCLPFLIGGTEDAAKFYGAYFAAITGLVGVVVGALINAELVRRRDDRTERVKVLAAVRIAEHELEDVKNSLDAIRKSLPLKRDDTERASVSNDGRYVSVSVVAANYTSTPNLDANLTPLCMQSKAIAKALLRFSSKRRDLGRAVETLSSPLYAKTDGYTWGHFATVLFLMELALDTSIIELNAFSQQHAGDFA